MTIGITGTFGAGKDEIARFFEDQGFHRYSHSDELRQIASEKQLDETRDVLFQLGNQLRKEKGNEILSKIILKKLKKPAVILSIRHPDEVLEYRKGLKDFILLSVDGPQKLRYQRLVLRKRAGEDKESFKDFVRKEERELYGQVEGQQIAKVMAMADVRVDNNFGTLELLDQKLTTLYQELQSIYNKEE